MSGIPLIDKIAGKAKDMAAHSWEYGAVSQALIEIYDPDLSPFFGHLHNVDRDYEGALEGCSGLEYARRFIIVSQDVLCDGEGSAGDPASLGVAALLLGKLDPAYFEASVRQKTTLLHFTPRCENGAISHRVSVAELWSDFTYMALPFLACLAYETQDDELFQDTVQQCLLQRQILAIEGSKLWRHVIGPENQDEGLWSSGNGWAICGLVRVFAILQKYNSLGRLVRRSSDLETALVRSISDIIGAAVASDSDGAGLLRSYLGDPTYFRENTGTAAVVSAIFRMATLEPAAVTAAEATWAEFAMHTVLSNIAEDGVVSPVANPMDSHDPTPHQESAEGQAFVMHMIAAHVDWNRFQSTHSQMAST